MIEVAAKRELSIHQIPRMVFQVGAPGSAFTSPSIYRWELWVYPRKETSGRAGVLTLKGGVLLD